MIEADVVLSNADPKRTFLKLLDEVDLDREIVEAGQGAEDAVGLRQVPLRPERAARLLRPPRRRLQPRSTWR